MEGKATMPDRQMKEVKCPPIKPLSANKMYPDPSNNHSFMMVY